MSSELASDIHFDSARSADESSKILEELKHEFVCSSCKANLLPPVKTCQNGHKICEKCKMYSNCAKCDLATKRVLHNVELENGRAKVNMDPISTPLVGCLNSFSIHFTASCLRPSARNSKLMSAQPS